MRALDLNCDLGEGEPRARTAALMRRITSANVACGGHAGDVTSMTRCVQLAKRHGVHLGAHPGPWSRGDFGRSAVRITPGDLELLLLHQVGALAQIARRNHVPLHHIKLHGALYHATDADERLANAYLRAVRQHWPNCIIYARAGGRVAQRASRLSVPVWPEAFADRAYHNDGTLVNRGEPGAVLTDRPAVIARVRQLHEHGTVETISGQALPLAARTLCVHADTPQAVALVAAALAASDWCFQRNLL